MPLSPIIEQESIMERITSQFGASSTAREVVAGHDLSGRTAIVTGGAAGLGLETVRALAEAGADVVIAARSAGAGEQAIATIAAPAAGRVSVESLELGSFASIRQFGARWGERPLDLLINNAGVMATPQGMTDHHLETQIGINHFGHFLLTTLLLPALEAGACRSGRFSRVVVLSSNGHRLSPMHFDDPHYLSRPYDKWEAYGQSKTANALFAVELSRRFKDRGIVANSLMPGRIRTELIRHLSDEDLARFGSPPRQDAPPPGYKTPEQGAATSVWAAVAPELEGIGGLYLEDCAQAPLETPEQRGTGVMQHALDPVAAERLWTLSERTTTAG
jgi:NAD(P)-dependent dehydrogenase (short-subunit alcohol dehydrogenase family)